LNSRVAEGLAGNDPRLDARLTLTAENRRIHRHEWLVELPVLVVGDM
jgi:hypothetical protein